MKHLTLIALSTLLATQYAIAITGTDTSEIVEVMR